MNSILPYLRVYFSLRLVLEGSFVTISYYFRLQISSILYPHMLRRRLKRCTKILKPLSKSQSNILYGYNCDLNAKELASFHSQT